MAGLGKQRLDKVRQQSEALGNHAGVRQQAQQVFNNPTEALAPEPVEGLEHGLRRPIHQRSSMSMILNLLRYGASSAVVRLGWSGITSSVEYTSARAGPRCAG
jgi:hypothetical protein